MSFDIKKFVVNVAVGLAVPIVRGYLNEQLKNVEPSDLYEAIIENKELWTVTPDTVKGTGRGFKNTYGNIFKEHEKEITTELLLKWMQEDHPALFSTIINTNRGGERTGIIWFDNQVNNIKQKIQRM